MKIHLLKWWAKLNISMGQIQLSSHPFPTSSLWDTLIKLQNVYPAQGGSQFPQSQHEEGRVEKTDVHTPSLRWPGVTILEVTRGHSVLWFQVSLPWSSYWAHTDHSFPHILLYLDSALSLTLGVYFIPYCEILKEKNTWKLFWRLLILLDRPHIYANGV